MYLGRSSDDVITKNIVESSLDRYADPFVDHIYYPVAIVSIFIRLEEEPTPDITSTSLVADPHDGTLRLNTPESVRPSEPKIKYNKESLNQQETYERFIGNMRGVRLGDNSGFYETVSQPEALKLAWGTSMNRIDLLPDSVSVVCNPYRQADECTFSFPLENLNIDPRMMANMGVVVYLGSYDFSSISDKIIAEQADIGNIEGLDDNYVKSIAYLKTNTASGELNVIKQLIMIPENIRFSGYADEVKVKVSETDGRKFEVHVRDTTACLLDSVVDAKALKSINWSEPIEKVVQKLISNNVNTAGIPVLLIGALPGSITVKSSQTKLAGKKGKGKKVNTTKVAKVSARHPKIEKESYWDVITDLSINSGLICYMDYWNGGTIEGPLKDFTTHQAVPGLISIPRIVLATPDFLLNEPLRAVGVPYYNVTSGNWGELAPSGIPSLYMGQSLSEYSATRKYVYENVPAVRMVCRSGKKTITGEFIPKEPGAKRVINATGVYNPVERREYVVSGYDNEKDLIALAESVYKELKYNSMQLDFSSEDLITRGQSQFVPIVDLMSLRAGDPVRIGFKNWSPNDYDDLSSEIKQQDSGIIMVGKKMGSVTTGLGQGGDILLGLIPTLWYVNEVTHTIDDSGYKMSGKASNYLDPSRKPSDYKDLLNRIS